MSKQPTWTDERIERLKGHFADGLSCREIAAEIGVSRNAVIGKLSRLQLTRDEKPKARPTEPGKPRARSVPRLQYRLLKKLFAEAPLAEDAEPIQSEQRCSLLELSEQRCRWPINSPGEEDFCFCGNPPLDGVPYCAGHTRLAYQPARRRSARG
jgi:GcrA cell cycle regulator